MALDPQLMARLGIKRGSELEAPAAGAPPEATELCGEGDGPDVLPWNAAQASARTRPDGESGTGERSDRSIERQHRENRIAAGTLRVPRARRAPADGEAEAGARTRREAAGGGAGREGSPARAQPDAPAPAWADVGAPPAWATDGELPERVSALLEEWDRREAEAAELIAAGVEVLPAEESSPREIVELSDDEAEQLARAICLRLLTAMPRTRHELEKKLLEREVPAAAACAVLDRYEELGIIDDAAFARAWVESRARSKGFARGRLKQELRRKGVDAEALESALEQIDAEAERERAEELALRKLGSRTLPPFGYGTPEAAEREKILRRVVGFLARKGYPTGTALTAARVAMERHDRGERR